MNELVRLLEEWAEDKGLDKADSSKQFLKVSEGFGKIAAALARNNRFDLQDAIGGTVVTLIILAMQNDMDLYDCLNSAYEEIADRKGKTSNGAFVKASDFKVEYHKFNRQEMKTFYAKLKELTK